MIAAVQRALREFQVGDVVDDRAHARPAAGRRRRGADGTARAADEPKVSVT